MSNNQYTSSRELSYYELSLIAFLRESHPHLVENRTFISERANSASERYGELIRLGFNHTEAEAAASEVLYRGLHFSPYDMIVHILWDEFADMVASDDARNVAYKLFPLCLDVLLRYDITDGFELSSEYDMLYTKLVGTIETLLNDGI